ncbi:hypothetical protein XU18_3715 [Perkinsela sp. CCAP 1560/4]|nr:hypothetical protein XU18_3715 [Perkinsela sp. CCAP 1560/4]|eukprot:KNH05231.1 hypothetical protein XU18_3715 [Perkinsela sp. CCAP 1560/4]
MMKPQTSNKTLYHVYILDFIELEYESSMMLRTNSADCAHLLPQILFSSSMVCSNNKERALEETDNGCYTDKAYIKTHLYSPFHFLWTKYILRYLLLPLLTCYSR